MPSRHAAARQQFMLPCPVQVLGTCKRHVSCLPAAARHRPEMCSPNACPDVSKAVQPIPRVPASLLQAYRCGTQAASREVSLLCECLCVRRAACLMGGPCQPPSWGEGWWVHPLTFCLPCPSFSPTCRVHPPWWLSWYVHFLSSYRLLSAGSRHLAFPQDEPSFRACRPRNALSSSSGREARPPSSIQFFCRRPRTHQSRF